MDFFESEAEEKKCETGCKTFTGGVKKHHKDCVFYTPLEPDDKAEGV